MEVRIEPFFDPATSTFSYVVNAKGYRECAIVDSVLGFELRALRVSTEAADKIASYIREHDLLVQWHLETHVHADHLSGADYLKQELGGQIGIGSGIVEVQRVFREIFDFGSEFEPNGSDFDHLFECGEKFNVGPLVVTVMHVPGHTPADVAFLFGESAAFVGDTIFMPDVGSARCDFPGGSAENLYKSARRILKLGEETRLFLCHDYPPDGREPICMTNVRHQRHANIHVRDGINLATFRDMRNRRDQSLSLPGLFFPSIQVNLRAGKLPVQNSRGRRFMQFPIDSI
ncbi:MBL fold metallo-hydrolase [Paraburkholderia sp. J8-2]|uniref:MBL fold metallo-hydrolase n=1 Tax=Paraburkholderia sp. J8-2 TaxID=2805440 RepID=UPI002AB6ABAA|nr:MBL fold metallo-hydrolase [Paraburkholderia sp. J8-2]